MCHRYYYYHCIGSLSSISFIILKYAMLIPFHLLFLNNELSILLLFLAVFLLPSYVNDFLSLFIIIYLVKLSHLSEGSVSVV
jgi:hypothetical protein